MTEPEMLSVPATAALLKVSTTTVRRYIAMGLLQATRMGRLWQTTPESVRTFRRTYKGEVPPEERGA